MISCASSDTTEADILLQVIESQHGVLAGIQATQAEVAECVVMELAQPRDQPLVTLDPDN
jgi:hypothetical protein